MREETIIDQEGEALDISITLTQPPGDSPSEVLASVTIGCDVLDLHYTGEPLTDPLTNEERKRLRWYLEEYWKWPYLEIRSASERGGSVAARGGPTAISRPLG